MPTDPATIPLPGDMSSDENCVRDRECRISRISSPRLREVLGLRGNCEICGAETNCVAFFGAGETAEICAACSEHQEVCGG